MGQKLKLSIAGLYTDPNSLSEQPEGALAVADNIVVDRPSIAESRRGFKQFNPTLSDPKKLFNYLDTILVQDGSTLKADDGIGGWTSISGVLDAPSSEIRPQNLQENQSSYFTSELGIQKLASLSSSLETAGAPPGLDLAVSLVAGTSIPNNSAVGYRVVWGKVDVNGILFLGAPSEFINVSNNSGAAKAASLDFTIPSGLTTDWFYQIYRSVATTAFNVAASDELQLTKQVQLVAGDLVTGTITVTDDVPEALLGAALYTNATQQGILQANLRPPFAQAMERFHNYTFFLNTRQPQKLLLNLIALPSVNDTVTVGGFAYTAKATENIASHEFAIGSGGTLAENISATVHSLIRNINRDSRLVYVYGYFIQNGNFYIERRTVEDTTFTATSSSSIIFSEVLPVTSTGDAKQNRLHISKDGQLWACPILQFEDIGRSDKAGLNLKANRDMLLIEKEDGAWRLTGTSPDNFIIEIHDSTLEFVGSETTAAFENTVFGSSTKGIVSTTPSGSNIISLPIQNEILRIQALTNFKMLSWGAAYDSDRKFLLGVPNAETSLDVEYVFIFNAKTNGWTRWPLDWRHAIVGEGDDKLYVIRISDGQVLQERKDLTRDDYADDEFPITISAQSGGDLTVTSVADLEVGMTIVQVSQEGLITEINGLVVTVDNEGPWTTGAATAFTPIEVRMRWSEEDAENPGILKFWQEITFLFQSCRFKTAGFWCSSTFHSGFIESPLISSSQAGWGGFGWGSLPWGSGRGGFQPIRTLFPREVARSLWVNIEVRLKQCFNSFALAGASVLFEPVSSRFK